MFSIQEPQVVVGDTTYEDAGSAWGNGFDFENEKGIADYFVFEDFATDKTVVLGMGRNEDNIGSVTVHLNAATNTLYVTYTTTSPYFLNQVHVYVGGTAPTKSAPGQFTNKYSVKQQSEYFQTYTFTINLLADFDTNGDEMFDGNPIYIAAHADILTESN